MESRCKGYGRRLTAVRDAHTLGSTVAQQRISATVLQRVGGVKRSRGRKSAVMCKIPRREQDPEKEL